MLLSGKQIRDGSIPNSKLATPGGRPSTLNKGMVASVATTDFAVACATAIGATPSGLVDVRVNGQSQTLGDGVKTRDCYMSGDSGTTARASTAIVSGDLLYWVPSVAGFSLDATDRIDLFFSN